MTEAERRELAEFRSRLVLDGEPVFSADEQERFWDLVEKEYKEIE